MNRRRTQAQITSEVLRTYFLRRPEALTALYNSKLQLKRFLAKPIFLLHFLEGNLS